MSLPNPPKKSSKIGPEILYGHDLGEEPIGNVPEGSIMQAYIVFKYNDEALIYMAPNLNYFDEEDQEWKVDKGCGSLSFARYNPTSKLWEKSAFNYLNAGKELVQKIEHQLGIRHLRQRSRRG